MKSLFVTLLFLLCLTAYPQEESIFPSLSPKGEITQVVGTTQLRISYERPSARKRKIFGDLVPYHEVWRTGAGYCTKMSFDKAVIIGKQPIEAGTYSLFTLPGPDEWIVMLNSDTTLYGSGFYDRKKDVIRFKVFPSETHRFYETLTIDIDLIPNDARIYISWANTQIHFDFETDTDAQLDAFIQEELLSGKNKDSDTYANAADHLAMGHRNLMTALRLAEKAFELDPHNGWVHNVKLHILIELKLYEEALQEAEVAIEKAKRKQYETAEIRAQEIQYWEAIKQKIVASQP